MVMHARVDGCPYSSSRLSCSAGWTQVQGLQGGGSRELTQSPTICDGTSCSKD